MSQVKNLRIIVYRFNFEIERIIVNRSKFEIC